MTVRLVPLSDAVTPSRQLHRQLISDVRAWALSQGRSVDPGLLALHLAVVDDDVFRHGAPVTHWTRSLVNEHLMHRSRNWCAMRRVLIPIEGFCETLWLLLGYLDATAQLDDASDSLQHLVEPLICYGGLGFDGLPRDDDSDVPFECACYFPVGTPMSVVRAARRRGRPAPPMTSELRSTRCYTAAVAREITQRELRNDSGEIMRKLDQGQSFVVTRNGVPVGELTPLRRRRFVPVVEIVDAFRGVPPVDLDRLRADLDAAIDQDPTPRA